MFCVVGTCFFFVLDAAQALAALFAQAAFDDPAERLIMRLCIESLLTNQYAESPTTPDARYWMDRKGSGMGLPCSCSIAELACWVCRERGMIACLCE